MKIGLVSAAALALLAHSAAALAQAPAAPAPPARVVTTITTPDYVEQRLDGNQVVTFPNDALRGDENSAYGFTIRRPPGVLRAGLIRPRMNFVSELLKTVENL